MPVLHASLRSRWPFDSASTTTYPPSSFPSPLTSSSQKSYNTPSAATHSAFKMTEHYPQPFVTPQPFEHLSLVKSDIDTDVFDCLDKQSFDFTHYGSYPDVIAPHPEQFETDLDISFAAFDQDVCNLPATIVDNPDIFSLRSTTPTRGIPSAFTASSESASVYDSVYGENLSSYSYNTHSPSSQYSASSYALTSEEIDMDFTRLGLDLVPPTDSFVTMPSPGSDHSSPGSLTLSSPATRGSFSDYEPSNQIRVTSSSMSDYYPSQRYPFGASPATISPANVSSQLPGAPQTPNMPRGPKSESGISCDPKRKYPCPSCPRGKFFYTDT